MSKLFLSFVTSRDACYFHTPPITASVFISSDGQKTLTKINNQNTGPHEEGCPEASRRRGQAETRGEGEESGRLGGEQKERGSGEQESGGQGETRKRSQGEHHEQHPREELQVSLVQDDTSLAHASVCFTLCPFRNLSPKSSRRATQDNTIA